MTAKTKFKFLAITSVVLWAIVATMIASSRIERLRKARQEIQSLTTNITKLEHEAETELAKAKQESEKILARVNKLAKESEENINSKTQKLNLESERIAAESARVKKDSEGIELREKDKMEKVFKTLRPYVSGINDVKQKYLASFSVDGKNAKLTLTNNSTQPVKPRVTIRLINRYGFITDSLSVTWVLDNIQPGETRIEEHRVIFQFGEPVYYQVTFADD